MKQGINISHINCSKCAEILKAKETFMSNFYYGGRHFFGWCDNCKYMSYRYQPPSEQSTHTVSG